MSPRPPDWAAVAEALLARLDQTGLTRQALAQRSGLSIATIRAVLSASRTATPQTLTALSVALGWPPGHLAALRDRQPTDSAELIPPSLTPTPPDLELVGLLRAINGRLAEQVTLSRSIERRLGRLLRLALADPGSPQ